MRHGACAYIGWLGFLPCRLFEVPVHSSTVDDGVRGAVSMAKELVKLTTLIIMFGSEFCKICLTEPNLKDGRYDVSFDHFPSLTISYFILRWWDWDFVQCIKLCSRLLYLLPTIDNSSRPTTSKPARHHQNSTCSPTISYSRRSLRALQTPYN